MLLQTEEQSEKWRETQLAFQTSKDHAVTKLIALTNQYLTIVWTYIYAIFKSLNFFEILGFWQKLPMAWGGPQQRIWHQKSIQFQYAK